MEIILGYCLLFLRAYLHHFSSGHVADVILVLAIIKHPHSLHVVVRLKNLSHSLQISYLSLLSSGVAVWNRFITPRPYGSLVIVHMPGPFIWAPVVFPAELL